MPDNIGALREFQETLGRYVDEETKNKILEGIEALSESSKLTEVAEWIKQTMTKMDELLDDETKEKVMVSCGYNCARINSGPIDSAVKRRKKHSSLEDFLQSEIKKSPRGMKLEKHGNTLYFYYTPLAYGEGMRCYCSLVKELPLDETISETYCKCSKGFVERYWEAVLEKPVKVQVIETAISGSTLCKFAVEV